MVGTRRVKKKLWKVMEKDGWREKEGLEKIANVTQWKISKIDCKSSAIIYCMYIDVDEEENLKRGDNTT